MSEQEGRIAEAIAAYLADDRPEDDFNLLVQYARESLADAAEDPFAGDRTTLDRFDRRIRGLLHHPTPEPLQEPFERREFGVRSYAAARRGEVVEPPARPVAYHRVELLAFAPRRAELPGRFAPGPDGWAPAASGRAFDLPPELAELPTALLRLEVGAGTYVRAFARDLGAALGVPAHLAGLVRTGAGGIDLARCTPLHALGEAEGLAPSEALDLPSLRLDAATALAVRQGKRLSLPLTGTTVLVDPDGQLAAIVEPREPRAPGGEAASTPVPVRILRAWQR